MTSARNRARSQSEKENHEPEMLETQAGFMLEIHQKSEMSYMPLIIQLLKIYDYSMISINYYVACAQQGA